MKRWGLIAWLSMPVGVAQAEGLSAGAHARFEARYLRRTDAAPAPYDDHVTGGLGVRAFGGAKHVQYGAGLDLFGGATRSAGFAYAAHLRPVGMALVDEDIRFSSTFGVGFDGVTGVVDPAMRLPLDALVELPLGGWVKLEVAAELAWLPIDTARSHERSLSVRWRFDNRYDKSFRGRSANGVYISFELAERHDATFIGAGLGYSLDGAFRF